jgi:hypothetical protein
MDIPARNALYTICWCFLSASILHQSQSSALLSALYQVEGTYMSRKLFSDLLLFQVPAASLVQCAWKCLETAPCNAVTVTSSHNMTSEVTCRGHGGTGGQRLTVQSSYIADANSKYFKVEGKIFTKKQ